MSSRQCVLAFLAAGALISSAQQTCHDQETCEDLTVADLARGNVMMQVNRKVAAGVSPERAASPVPVALSAAKVENMVTAKIALQAAHLQGSRSCVPMALQEVHLQSIRQYAAMLATGDKALFSEVASKALTAQGHPSLEVTTAAPTSAGACAMPAGASACSLITEGDATVGAHDVYTCLAVGGTLYDGTPQESGVVGGQASYLHKSGGAWNFNGGETEEALKFDWSTFASLAQTAQSSESSLYKVVVLTQGGTYNLSDFRGPDAQGNDNGTTLVIFNTEEDVVLTGTQDGRQFGPSVLAPFSKVTLQGDAGYIDGCLISKTFATSGADGQLQMHGNCYSGPITCEDNGILATGTPTTEDPDPVTEAPATDAPATEAPVTEAPIIAVTEAPVTGGFSCDADGFKEATSLCCPLQMEIFFTGLLHCMGLEVCSKPHVQGLMHWFTCVPHMDFQYMLNVIKDGHPCKYWTPIGQTCPALSAQCQGEWCR